MLPAAASSAWPSRRSWRASRAVACWTCWGRTTSAPPRQGRGRPRRRLQARPPERADPVVAMAGTQFVYLIGGRSSSRRCLRCGDGPPGRQRHLPAGLHDDPGRRARADLGSGAGQPHPRSPVPRDRPADRLQHDGHAAALSPGPRLAPGRGPHRRRPGRGGAGRAMARATRAHRDLRARRSGPGRALPAGTDEVGRDVLSRVLYGAQASLGVAIPSGAGRAGRHDPRRRPRLPRRRAGHPRHAPVRRALLRHPAGHRPGGRARPERLNLILTIAVLTLPQFAVLARSATWP